MADVFPAKRPERRGGRENSLVCRLGGVRGRDVKVDSYVAATQQLHTEIKCL